MCMYQVLYVYDRLCKRAMLEMMVYPMRKIEYFCVINELFFPGKSHTAQPSGVINAACIDRRRTMRRYLS